MNLLQFKWVEAWAGYAPTVLRIGVGIVFAVHGWQKLTEMGLVGVAGFLGSLGFPVPTFFATILIFVELVGGLALIFGAWTRIASKLLAIDMLVAMFVVHWKNGFYVQNGGYEFVLILFFACTSLVLSGSGPLSLDNYFKRKEQVSQQ